MPIFVTLFLSLLVSFPCLAQGSVLDYQCPNKIECKQRLYDNYGNTSEQTLGTLEAKCCYKIPTGCRPWHCDGDTTDDAHWQSQCNKKFPECLDNHHGYTDISCTPHYKSY